MRRWRRRRCRIFGDDDDDDDADLRERLRDDAVIFYVGGTDGAAGFNANAFHRRVVAV